LAAPLYLHRSVILALSIVGFACASRELVSAEEQRPATVLLVTSDELAPHWTPFADWKTRLGKSTRVVTVDEIKAAFKGADVQAKIRACVLDSIRQHGTRWVILGGDSLPGGSGHVPDRDTLHPGYRHRDIPTDVYYISEQSWDANGDGVYGEWEKDRDAVAYTNPHASIGRIPVRTAADVEAYTAKVIAYETRYPKRDFAARMVYACPVEAAYPKLVTSRKTMAAAWGHGEALEFFGNRTPWDESEPGDHDLSPANWMRLFNERVAGKLHLHGHGLLPLWVLEKHQKLDRSHVARLKHPDAYPVITTVSCFTGQFDDAKDPSITESMLRQPSGGAVVLVAPARQGTPVFHDRADFRRMVTEGKMDGTTRILTLFWTLGLERGLTAGEAWAAARGELAEDGLRSAGFHFCQSELNLLGDPTLDLRARDPVTPPLELPEVLLTGDRTFEVRTAPGATVCAWMEGEVYRVVTADTAGTARLSTSAASSGEMHITASGASLNATTRTVRVQHERVAALSP